MTISMFNLQKNALVGGKGSNRIIYLQYYDNAAPVEHKYAKLEWPVADTKPTFLSSITVQTLISTIETANPLLDIDYPSYASSFNSMLMIGASDYGSFFVCFRDTSSPQVRYIAEIGSSWEFLRFIDFYDYTSETDIKFIDIVDDEVYITAGNPAIESTYLSDDFTGSNGDPPDPKKWNIISGSPDIQNNTLELTQIGTGTADYVTTTYLIGGGRHGSTQVDISVDFELMNYVAINSWGIDLVINGYETGNPYAYVRFGYWGGQYGYQFGYVDSGWHTVDVMIGGSPDTTGKLRIVSRKRQDEYKTGYDELKAYYWNGSVWVLIGEHNNFALREGTFSLRVDNSTPAQNITWRADNFTVKSGFNVYREIYVYDINSFNAVTNQFETLIRSKNTEVYDVLAVSAGTGGCVAMRYKHGWYLTDQPHECYTDLVSYDESLGEVAVSCLRAEYVLGNLCTWQRDIYFGDNWFDSGPWLVCGNYPNELFFVGSLLFLNGDDTYLALIEVGGTTLKPTRASLLQTTGALFDGSEIQDAIAVP